MINLIKCTDSDISLEFLESLWDEAYPLIQAERQRMGDEKLKEALFNLTGCPVIKYEVNGYPVGICSYTPITALNKTYMFHRHPLYRADSNGSRSWWYSEEFQQKNSEYVRNEGFAGLISLFNESDAASNAVLNHFGSFGKYYSPPVIIKPADIGLHLHEDAKSLKMFRLDLMDN